MNQENNRSYDCELLPHAVIEAAHAGDPSAMDRVLRHYGRRYLAGLSLSRFIRHFRLAAGKGVSRSLPGADVVNPISY